MNRFMCTISNFHLYVCVPCDYLYSFANAEVVTVGALTPSMSSEYHAFLTSKINLKSNYFKLTQVYRFRSGVASLADISRFSFYTLFAWEPLNFSSNAHPSYTLYMRLTLYTFIITLNSFYSFSSIKSIYNSHTWATT